MKFFFFTFVSVRFCDIKLSNSTNSLSSPCALKTSKINEDINVNVIITTLWLSQYNTQYRERTSKKSLKLSLLLFRIHRICVRVDNRREIHKIYKSNTSILAFVLSFFLLTEIRMKMRKND
jgi:hypothetical protein